jgi:hypothetical protein
MNRVICGVLALVLSAITATVAYAGVQDGNLPSGTIATTRTNLSQCIASCLAHPDTLVLNTPQQSKTPQPPNVAITQEALKTAKSYRKQAEGYTKDAESTRKWSADKQQEMVKKAAQKQNEAEKKAIEKQIEVEKKESEKKAKLYDAESAALSMAAILLENGIWTVESNGYYFFNKYDGKAQITLAVLDKDGKRIYQRDTDGKSVLKTEKIFGAEFRYALAVSEGYSYLYDTQLHVDKLYEAIKAVNPQKRSAAYAAIDERFGTHFSKATPESADNLADAIAKINAYKDLPNQERLDKFLIELEKSEGGLPSDSPLIT